MILILFYLILIVNFMRIYKKDNDKLHLKENYTDLLTTVFQF